MPVYRGRERSRSRSRSGDGTHFISTANFGHCAFCSTPDKLEWGRDLTYCSSACYRDACVGADALTWEPQEVATWLHQQGLQRLVHKFGWLDGHALFVMVNEGWLVRLGMKVRQARQLMRAIESLRQGAWCQPEPPLKDLPLPTVAIKGKAMNDSWNNVLEDTPRRSYAALCRRAIDEATAWRWFETLKEGLPWQDLRDAKYQQEGKTIPRRTIFVVDRGCACEYGYSGVRVPPLEEPAFVTEIRKTCARIAGFSEDEMPNSCNINLYRDGNDSVGWHTDNEPLFEAEYNDACILSLSLGASRNFTMKEQPAMVHDGKPKAQKLAIHHGDLCTMEGKFQRYYLHAIPKEPQVSEPRINLTWRWITKHNKASGCTCHGPGN